MFKKLLTRFIGSQPSPVGMLPPLPFEDDEPLEPIDDSTARQQQAYEDSRRHERQRLTAILSSPEAEGRSRLAAYLATSTDLTPEAALSILAATDREATANAPNSSSKPTAKELNAAQCSNFFEQHRAPRTRNFGTLERTAAAERRGDNFPNNSQLRRCRRSGRYAEMNMPTLTPVAHELDSAYDAGMTVLAKLASDGKALREMKEALRDSGMTMDTDIIDPIFSPGATAQDVEFFKANPTRTHNLRAAIDGETALAGRVPASDFVVCVRQIQSGFRVLVAIRLDRLDIGPDTRTARLNDDELLAMVFEMATRKVQGHHIYIGKIVAYVHEMRSASATTETQSMRRRLS